ncbi:MAG: protease HtpX [Desulfarculus sp.]|nr:MAG: protease HtpX [Desulfarculus sp.]
MFKRVFLLVLVNFLVLMTLLFITRMLGVDRFFAQTGLNYQALLIFAVVIGFGGAFISLALSRVMARWTMGVQIIDSSAASGDEAWLVNTVHNLARGAGLNAVPQVGVYPSEEVNAFATGPTRSRSLVAVSSGLLERLDREAVAGVLAHELSHVNNGDMVTMTLLQGVINTFVVFLSRAAAFAVAQASRSDEDDSAFPTMTYFLVSIVLEICLAILGSLVVMGYSRWREYGADAGGASLAGRGAMIHALESLLQTKELVDTSQKTLNTLKIAGGGSWMRLFASHPPLEERIARLRQGA